MHAEYAVTGLMSGSSLDGVDLAYCEFSRNAGKWDFTIVEAVTIPYPSQILEILSKRTEWDQEQLQEMDHLLGYHYATLLNDFHQKTGRTPELISSHGHTILHEPDRGITFQAGSGDIMAERTGITVVSDFRREDVAQGGQGAPLVPVGDRLLFGQYGACINLGGFSNISFENDKGRRIAYDTGPANIVLNWIAGLRGMEFDRDGKLALEGRVDPLLLERINALEYFHRQPPKSLGKEWFTGVLIPILEDSGLEIPDLMATMVEQVAIQLSASIRYSRAGSVLITGGGALNSSLIGRLKLLTGVRLDIPGIRLVKYKEALVFAFLGLLRNLGEVNCLASVTGGRSDLSAGTIHYKR